MKRITIKDLAKLLNVAPSTVSRALSDHPDISEATKKKVQEAAEEFNYTANLHARMFRKQHSGLIAVILPEINMFFSPSLIRGINKAISNTNYSIITFLTNDSFKREKEIIKQCLNWAVEGVLISLSKETYDTTHLEPLKKAKIPCVLLDKAIDSAAYTSVTIDSLEASYKAVSHLIEKGHKNIIGIFGNPVLSISKERLQGYRQALEDHGIPYNEENVISVDQNTSLDFILPPILNHNKNITAIFTMSDELLVKSLFHLDRLEFNIPNDISVISISDGVYPYLSHPQISHIKDSGSKMGKTACKVLLDKINNEEEDIPFQKTVGTKLINLQSVKIIPQQ